MAFHVPLLTRLDVARVVTPGREADGVSQTLLREADERVYFPLHGFSDSLNVSSSVALILDALIER